MVDHDGARREQQRRVRHVARGGGGGGGVERLGGGVGVLGARGARRVGARRVGATRAVERIRVAVERLVPQLESEVTNVPKLI